MKRKSTIILAAAAGVALAAGVARATIPDGAGVIHACYSRSGGALRVLDDSVTSCKAAETSLAWGVAGPVGPPGPAGDDSTRTVFGAVNGDGTSQFATDDFSVERLGTGHYKLTFAPGTFAQPPGLVVMPIGPSFVGGMSGTGGSPATGFAITYVLADIATGQLTDTLHTFIATPATQG
jgi:hypothetical protein